MSMKRVLIIVVIFALTLALACNPAPTGEKTTDSGKGYSVKVIDGCEYIEVSFALGVQSGYYSLTHKGNCKNPIHSCSTVTEIAP